MRPTRPLREWTPAEQERHRQDLLAAVRAVRGDDRRQPIRVKLRPSLELRDAVVDDLPPRAEP
jgi:hypothetical protein